MEKRSKYDMKRILNNDIKVNTEKSNNGNSIMLATIKATATTMVWIKDILKVSFSNS